MITISFRRPKVNFATETYEPEGDIVDKAQAIFSKRNVLLFSAGVAVGVIARQQREIATLKRTVYILQEVVAR